MTPTDTLGLRAGERSQQPLFSESTSIWKPFPRRRKTGRYSQGPPIASQQYCRTISNLHFYSATSRLFEQKNQTYHRPTNYPGMGPELPFQQSVNESMILSCLIAWPRYLSPEAQKSKIKKVETSRITRPRP